MEAAEIEVKINKSDGDFIQIRIFPIDLRVLGDLLSGMCDSFKINKIHAIIFDEADERNDFYLNDANQAEVLKNINSIQGFTEYFYKQLKDFTINKLELSCGNIKVLYDDDALVYIWVPKKSIFAFESFSKKLLSILVN